MVWRHRQTNVTAYARPIAKLLVPFICCYFGPMHTTSGWRSIRTDHGDFPPRCTTESISTENPNWNAASFLDTRYRWIIISRTKRDGGTVVEGLARKSGNLPGATSAKLNVDNLQIGGSKSGWDRSRWLMCACPQGVLDKRRKSLHFWVLSSCNLMLRNCIIND